MTSSSKTGNNNLESEQPTNAEYPDESPSSSSDREKGEKTKRKGRSHSDKSKRFLESDSPDEIDEILESTFGDEAQPPPNSQDKKPHSPSIQPKQDSENPLVGVTAPLKRPQIIGRSGCLVTIIAMLLIGGGIALRYSGWLPLQFKTSTDSPLKENAMAGEFNSNYTLVAAPPGNQRKLYFFDQRSESISEVIFDPVKGPGKPTTRGKVDLIPSVDRIVTSPNGQKVALIANRDHYRNGIYVLDFSQTDESGKFMAHWSRGLPSGYSVRSLSIASWSPDNNVLAFVASKGGQPDLFIASSEDQVQRVTYLGKNIGTVSWLDDEHIAFVSDWEGKDQMYVIRNNGGDLRKIPR